MAMREKCEERPPLLTALASRERVRERNEGKEKSDGYRTDSR